MRAGGPQQVLGAGEAAVQHAGSCARQQHADATRNQPNFCSRRLRQRCAARSRPLALSSTGATLSRWAANLQPTRFVLRPRLIDIMSCAPAAALLLQAAGGAAPVLLSLQSASQTCSANTHAAKRQRLEVPNAPAAPRRPQAPAWARTRLRHSLSVARRRSQTCSAERQQPKFPNAAPPRRPRGCAPGCATRC